MMTPRVSVIMPARNAERTIHQSIESVLSISNIEYELIVVDDDSGDGTVSIVESYEDPRIICIRSGRVGQAEARNIGVKYANGEYLQFLDSDDLIAKDKILLQLLALEKCDPRAVAVSEWYVFEGNVDNIIYYPNRNTWRNYDNPGMLIVDMQYDNYYPTHSYLIPSQLLSASVAWPRNARRNEDGLFFAKILAAASTVVFVEGAKVYYRNTENSVTKNWDNQAFRSWIRTIDEIGCIIEEKCCSIPKDKQVRQSRIQPYISYLYHRRHGGDSLRRKLILRKIPITYKILNNPRIGSVKFKLISILVGLKGALLFRRVYEVVRKRRESQANM